MKALLTNLIFLTLAGASAKAGILNYNCNVTDGNGTEQDIVINGKNISLTSTDKMNGMTFSAVLDPNYRPQASSIEKVRFLGTELGNGRQVVLPKTMLAGVASGFMQIRGTEDGYWSADFKCVRK